MRIAGYFAIAFFALASVGQLFIYLPSLPERVASHFGANGAADGFMPKSSYIRFMVGLHVGLPLFIVIIAATLKFVPSSLINIPNRDYWLQPSLRAQTLRENETMLVWIGVATCVFLMGLSHLTYVANKNANGLSMPWFVLLMILFISFVLGVALRSIFRYRKIPTADS